MYKAILKTRQSQILSLRTDYKKKNAKQLGGFGEFILEAWQQLYSTIPLQLNWHHQLIAEWLEYLHDKNDGTNLIVNMPPRHLKSIISSIIFPAYAWSKRPTDGFLSISYNAPLATEHNLDRRKLIESPIVRQYQLIELGAGFNRATYFKNQYNAAMIATGFHGVTGKGGDWLIFDDPNDPAKVESKIQREATNQSFAEYSFTRRNNLKKGSTIVIQQRTHAKDCTWKALQVMPNAVVLKLPLIALENERIVFPISKRVVVRNQGELLHPERFGDRELQTAKLLGSYLFNCRYQQSPDEISGSSFNPAWWQWYDIFPETETCSETVWACDTAFKTKQGSDFSVLLKMSRTYSGRYYVRELIRGKWAYPELRETIANISKEGHSVYIEDAASGQSIIQELKRNLGNIIAIPPPDRDKFSRAIAISPILEKGLVYLPSEAPWLPAFLEEMAEFNQDGNYAHDDQIDAFVHALEILKKSTFWDLFSL